MLVIIVDELHVVFLRNLVRDNFVVDDSCHTITTILVFLAIATIVISDNLADRNSAPILDRKIKTLLVTNHTSMNLGNGIPLINKTNSIVGANITNVDFWVLYHLGSIVDGLLMTCIQLSLQLWLQMYVNIIMTFQLLKGHLIREVFADNVVENGQTLIK